MKPFYSLILVAVGGALGALSRYGLSGLIQGNRVNFPVGTLVVNLLGCLLMGLLMRLVDVRIVSPELRLLLGLGVLGGFTTFSSFSFEALRLYQQHQVLAALAYVGASVVGCLVLVATGYVLASMLWRG